MAKSVGASRVWSILAVCGAAALCACQEEAKKEELPPNKPRVEQGQAKCEKVEERFVLQSLSFEVQDMDGVADLKKVEARVERYADVKPLDTASIPLTPEMVATEEFMGPVRATYSWQRSATGPNFYCGEDGRLLDIYIRAEDVLGYADEILIAPTAL